MKKIILAAIILPFLYSGLLTAQTSKGNILLGLSTTFNSIGSSNNFGLGYSSSNHEYESYGNTTTTIIDDFKINVTPRIGYFLFNNFVMGIDLKYYFTKTRFRLFSTEHQTQWQIGPFLRYYLLKSKVKPFIEIGGSFGNRSYKRSFDDKTYNNDLEMKYSIMTFEGGIGLAIQICKQISLDLVTMYNLNTYKNKDTTQYSQKSTTNNLGLGIGFTIFLESNKK